MRSVHDVVVSVRITFWLMPGARLVWEISAFHPSLASVARRLPRLDLTARSGGWRLNSSFPFSLRMRNCLSIPPKNLTSTPSLWLRSRYYILRLKLGRGSPAFHPQVFTGLVPFHLYQRDPAVISGVMSAGKRPERPSQATELGLTDGLWDLIQSAWAEDATKRPSVPTIIDVLLQVMTRRDPESQRPFVASSRSLGPPPLRLKGTFVSLWKP